MHGLDALLAVLFQNGKLEFIRPLNEERYFHFMVDPYPFWVSQSNLIPVFTHEKGAVYTQVLRGSVIPIADLLPPKKSIRIMWKWDADLSYLSAIPTGQVLTSVGLFGGSTKAPLQTNLRADMSGQLTFDMGDGYNQCFSLNIAGVTHTYISMARTYARLFGAMLKYGNTSWLINASAAPYQLKKPVPHFYASDPKDITSLSLHHYVKYKGAIWLRYLVISGMYKFVRPLL